MAGQEQVCCGALPAVDQDLAPLFRSPAGLMHNQPVDASLAREFQSATLCLASVSKEQAVASGRSLAQLWVVRRHLCLSQLKLQPADRDCLLRVPVEPTAMFGPQASSLLQQTRDRRRCADEVSESLGSRGKRARHPGAPTPRVASQSVAQAWGPRDLRHRLQAPRGHEPRPCQGDGFPKALESPTLVEGPSQHQERADHGTHRVTLLWSLRKTSRLLATNCTIQSDKGTRFGLRSQVVPLPWMILRTSRPLATNRTTQSD
ncbi:unnamed protein product [Gadus morhua 'NCC']